MFTSKGKKGFTLIELITTVAIIGILVLMASSRFGGYVEKAKIVQIKNDVVVMENEVAQSEILEINTPSEWTSGTVGHSNLRRLVDSNSIYDRRGEVKEKDEIKQGIYNVVPKSVADKIRSNLTGEFYYNGRDKVYYSKREAEGVKSYSEKEIDDFIKKENDVIPVANYEDLMAIGSGGEHIFAEGTKWETKRTTHISDERFYMQVNDIDLVGKDYEPIGGSYWAFRGSYNGGNFTIRNLSSIKPNKPFSGMFGKVFGSTIMDLKIENIDVEADYSGGGLIGYVENDAETIISNVHLTGKIKSGDNTGGLIGYSGVANILDSSVNVDVTGGNIGGAQGFIGGLIGNSSNDTIHSIENTHVTANINVKNGHRNVGGIAGSYGNEILNSSSKVTITGGSENIGGIAGDIKSGGKITNSHSIVTIISNGRSVGGLVGDLSNGGLVTNSYSDVNLTTTGSNVGGIVGENFGIIENSYSIGSIEGSYDVGGIVGDNRNIVKNTFSTASVKATDISRETVGGIIGKRSSSGRDTMSSFFAPEISKVNKGVGNHSDVGAKGITAQEMRSKETYIGWDFNNVWELIEGSNYPTLR